MTEEKEVETREKPPAKYGLNSWRFRMSILMLFALFTRTSLRVDMSMAAVCMVNTSYSEEVVSYPDSTETDSQCSYLAQENTSDSGYNGDLPWTQAQVNRLFSASFYGVLTSVWISGYFSDKFDAKNAILIAMINSVIVTLLTPTLAEKSVWAVFGARYIMGLGDGFIVPAIFSIASRWFPHSELASFAALYTSGEQLGVLLTMPISSFLCASETLRWPSIFYFFGALGSIFVILWFFFATSSPEQNKYISEPERIYLRESIGKYHKKKSGENGYKLVLTSRAYWAATTAQLSFAFSVVLMQVYLPLFLKQILKVSLKTNGLFALLPFLMQIVSKNVNGNIGDFLKKKGMLTNTQAAKLFQVLGNIGTGSCFLILALFIDCDTVFLATIVLAIYGCFVSCGVLGFYTALLSIAPRFSATVSALSVFVGSLTHANVPTIVGFLNENGTRAEWRKIWFTAAFLHCLAAIVFGILGSADVQEWAKVAPEVDKEEKIKLKDISDETDAVGTSMRIHRERILYPEIAETDCSFVKILNATAKVDNFDSKNTETWQQMYQLNDQYFHPDVSNPVIFLYISGESEAEIQYACWSNFTHMKWAQKHNALVVQLEHRFFGNSYPKWTDKGLADMSLETLSLLSPQQAVEDLANFIRTFQYDGKPLNNARWVAIGGSYPGAVCAWFRAKYPDLTVGAVCSSAPVWPKVDFYEFAEVIEFAINDWDPRCADNIRAGFTEIRQLTYTDKGHGILNELFNITPALDPQTSSDFDFDVTNFLNVLFQGFHRVVEYTFDGRNNLTVNGYGVNSLCDIINQPLNLNEPNVTRIRNAYFWIMLSEYGDDSKSTNNSYSKMMEGFQQTAFDVTVNDDRNNAAARGWMWLCCGVALGWLETTDNGNSIFNRIVPLSYYMKQCNDTFGPEIDTAYVTNKTAQTVAYFGVPWNYTAANIVLPNGGYDPWHALGTYVNNTERHQLSVLIPKAGHCSDMYPKWKDEPAALASVRAVIEAEVDYFIDVDISNELVDGVIFIDGAYFRNILSLK
ncbi:hypothetical protein FO519_007217 [Halicephalobus sp. NKZ332]|nr:hypothetical protein FO519_007217 [Halicephalobus sp. NKZ332]